MEEWVVSGGGGGGVPGKQTYVLPRSRLNQPVCSGTAASTTEHKI